MKTKRVGLITLTIVIGAGMVIAILWYTEQRQNMQLMFVEQTSTPLPTLYFTATLVSPDRQLTLLVECSQSQYGAAGPECYVVFPNDARMQLQSVSLPDEHGQRHGSANWSTDNSDWLLEYAGNGTEQTKDAAFLCDKVSHE